MKSISILAMTAAIGVTACGDDGGGSQADAAGSSIDATVADIDAAPVCPATTIIYVNVEGGTYTPGVGDSVANTTAFFSEETVLDAFPLADMDARDYLVNCVETGFAPYNAEVVTTDPGDVDHQEIVFTGTPPEDLGLQMGIGSLAPASCAVEPRQLSLVFRNGSLADSCRNGLWNTGHVYTLSPTIDCTDAMTTVGACDNFMPAYADIEATCGYGEAMNCTCTGETTQNSHQLMLAALGATGCTP